MGMNEPPPQTPPPPPPPPASGPVNDPVADVAEGQKLIIYAILVNILAAVLRVTLGEIFGLIQLGAIVLAIIGLMRLAGGMGWSTGVKVLLVILALIPLVSLVMLVIVNGRATERLRANGYHVGLMGAKKL